MKSVDTIARVRRAFHVQGWSLIRDLANGTFVADQRNAVLIGGAEPASRIWPSP